MKKHTYLFAFALVLSVSVPQVASAAWWNPFSWGIFNRSRVEVSNPAKPVEIACTMDARACPDGSYVGRVAPSCDFAACPTAKPAEVKPKPATQPVRTDAVPSSGKPATPIIKAPAAGPVVSSPKPSASATSSAPIAKPVDVPVFALNNSFTPAGFIAPLSVKSGTPLLAIEPIRGSDAQALGLWYVDSVTWKVDSDGLRPGDFSIAVYSGGRWVEDASDAFGQSHTTRLTSHVASDSLSWSVNSRVPNNGTFHIVVESISGHMKDSVSSKSYAFIGTPLTGPEFRF